MQQQKPKRLTSLEVYLRFIARELKLEGHDDPATLERVAHLIGLSFENSTQDAERFEEKFFSGSQYSSLDVLRAKIALLKPETDPDTAKRFKDHLQALSERIGPNPTGAEAVAFLGAAFQVISELASAKTGLISFNTDPKQMNLKVSHWGAYLLAKSFCELLEQENPPNYLFFDFGIPERDLELGQVIICRKNGETPTRKAQRLEAENAELRAQLEELKRGGQPPC